MALPSTARITAQAAASPLAAAPITVEQQAPTLKAVLHQATTAEATPDTAPQPAIQAVVAAAVATVVAADIAN